MSSIGNLHNARSKRKWMTEVTLGHVGSSGDSALPSNAPALPAGTAAPGSSLAYARGDHVHPAQTVPAASSVTPATPTVAGTAGALISYARGDHAHPFQDVSGEQDATLPAGWAGTGSAARPVTAVLADLPRSILDFPGADAEDQLVAALASGHKRLFVPAGTTVSLNAFVAVPDGTHLSGQPGSLIEGVGIDMNLLESGNSCVFEDLTLICAEDVDPSYKHNNTKPRGAAILVNGVGSVKIRRVDVSGHTLWGICFRSAFAASIEDSYIHGGILQPTPYADTSPGDIAVLGHATDILIQGNRLIGGSTAFSGVHCQSSTIASGVVTQDLVRIIGNTVTNHGGYGILSYNKDITQDILKRIMIRGNTVKGVTGAIPFDNGSGGLYQYGPGIYSLGAQSVFIEHNDVMDCLASNVDETLGVANILINDAAVSSVSHNFVDNSTKHGISVRNTQFATIPTKSAKIIGNTAINCAKVGIRLVWLKNFIAAANGCYLNFDGLTVLGDSTVTSTNGVVALNLSNENTQDGLSTDTSTVQFMTLLGNNTNNNGRYGHFIRNINDSIIALGMSAGNTSRQYNMNSGVTVRSFVENVASGTAEYVLSEVYPQGILLDPATTGSVVMNEKSPRTVVQTSPLTGNMAFTLPSASSNNLPLGYRIEFIRTAAATGAFTFTANSVSCAAGERMVHVITASGSYTCIEKVAGVP